MRKRIYTVLCVDDTESIRTGIEKILNKMGHICVAVDGPRKAITTLKEEKGLKFDVLLSDIELPEMNGIQLIKIVQAHDPTIKVIVMSANPLEKILARFRCGDLISARNFLFKPFEPDALLHTIEDNVAVH
ncbi:MAG: response regulator [bacterium]